MHRMCAAALGGDSGTAAALNDSLQPLYDALALESNPIPVKWAAYELKLAGSAIRAPLVELEDPLRGRLRQVLEELGLAH